ncbi:hypothetical protein MRB53_033587 [Persea americana]|uniref:Uncharacterized protein n=1 Tax=Persea americana TaxID=3435 RepID=A0ACC2KVF5_PERAE|nr:hypothetical protein MRB53_033587 [Persea americana]
MVIPFFFRKPSNENKNIRKWTLDPTNADADAEAEEDPSQNQSSSILHKPKKALLFHPPQTQKNPKTHHQSPLLHHHLVQEPNFSIQTKTLHRRRRRPTPLLPRRLPLRILGSVVLNVAFDDVVPGMGGGFLDAVEDGPGVFERADLGIGIGIEREKGGADLGIGIGRCWLLT